MCVLSFLILIDFKDTIKTSRYMIQTRTVRSVLYLSTKTSSEWVFWCHAGPDVSYILYLVSASGRLGFRQQLASLVRVPESRKCIIETAENRIPKFYFLITSVHDHGATWSIFRLAISTVLSSWSRTRCEPRLWEAWSYPKLSRRAKVNGSFRKHFLIRTNFPELCRLREYVH